MTSWLMPALIVAAILVGQFVLLHQIGLFPVPATESGEKTLAAALVLIGTAVTAAVTLIGVVIKTSIDIRTANDTAIEANRTHLLALEGERRNRVDTVIRAVGLLGSDGKDATPHQISGALLALESLGEYDLAVALAAHLWPHDSRVPPRSGARRPAGLHEGIPGDPIRRRGPAARERIEDARDEPVSALALDRSKLAGGRTSRLPYRPGDGVLDGIQG